MRKLLAVLLFGAAIIVVAVAGSETSTDSSARQHYKQAMQEWSSDNLTGCLESCRQAEESNRQADEPDRDLQRAISVLKEDVYKQLLTKDPAGRSKYTPELIKVYQQLLVQDPAGAGRYKEELEKLIKSPVK